MIEWKPDIDYNVIVRPAARIFEVIPSTDAIVLNVYAYNHADLEAEPDVRYYDVIRKTRTGDLYTDSPVMAPMAPGAEAAEPNGSDNGSGSVRFGGSWGTFMLVGIGILASLLQF